MQIDVIYAANLKIGDWYAGQVVPGAPTRPVQEILRALEITAVRDRRDAEGIRRVYAESNGMVLSSILASRQVMVIRGPYPGIPSSAPTVTVTYARKHWSLAFSKLPGQKFGPYDLPGAVGQLRVAALLEPIDARNLVLDAAAADDHTATAQTGE